MDDDFADPSRLVRQDLSADNARAYEERTVAELRQAMMGQRHGLVVIDAIELAGTRPDTLVVFRYHHRGQYRGDPSFAEGPQAEIATLWEFAIDPDDQYTQGMMDSPGVLAAAIGSAFEAAELSLADPQTLSPIGSPSRVFPRLLSEES